MDESAIITRQAQESLHSLLVLWNCGVLHSGNLRGIRQYSLWSQQMSKVRHYLANYARFADFELHASFSNSPECVSKMLQMLVECLREDQQVVNVHRRVLIQDPSQHLVHVSLESCGSVAQPKR